MEKSSVISLLSFVIVLLFLFFAFFLLTVKTNKKLSNRLLAAFLIITAIDISVFFLPQFYRFTTFIRNASHSDFFF